MTLSVFSSMMIAVSLVLPNICAWRASTAADELDQSTHRGKRCCEVSQKFVAGTEAGHKYCKVNSLLMCGSEKMSCLMSGCLQCQWFVRNGFVSATVARKNPSKPAISFTSPVASNRLKPAADFLKEMETKTNSHTGNIWDEPCHFSSALGLLTIHITLPHRCWYLLIGDTSTTVTENFAKLKIYFQN